MLFIWAGLLLNETRAQSADDVMFRVIHAPTRTCYARIDIFLSAQIEPYGHAASLIRIYYRNKGDEDYAYAEMTEDTDGYSGKIPGDVVRAPAMEYLIVAMSRDDAVATAPAQNAYHFPYEITIIERTQTVTSDVDEKTKTQSDYFEILHPEPNIYVSSEDPQVIAIGFKGDLFKSKISAISLFLDNKNQTSKAVVSEHILTFTADKLKPGRHYIILNGHDSEGSVIDMMHWAFQVRDDGSKKQIGKLSLGGGKLFSDIRSERVKSQRLNTYNSGFNIYGEYNHIRYSASSFFSSLEEDYLQPRNRYFFEIGTRKIGMRLGDINPRFNDFILWGKRVRGLGLYLTLGYFNLDFVYGQTNRANEGTPYPFIVDGQTGEKIYLHPQSGDTVKSITGILQTGVYTQNLIGLRPSFGSGNKFQLALNFLKVKDDHKSIENGVLPQDNIVIGPEISAAFDQKRIVFTSQAAYSVLTKDISSGALSKSDIDSVFNVNLPIDPKDYSSIIILNGSTRPLAPKELTSLSYQARLSLNYLKNKIMITYKNIGSDYYSLGNSFLRTNLRGFSVYDRIHLWNKQLFLNLGYEYFHDKLDNQRDTNPETDITLLHTISVGLSFLPMSSRIPKLNVMYRDHNRDNELQSTYAIKNNTEDISIELGYNFNLFNLSNSVNFGINGSNRIDDINPIYSNLLSDLKLFTLRTEYSIPLNTTLSYSGNRTETGKEANLMTFDFQQLTASAMYLLFETRLKLNASMNYIIAKGSSKPAGSDVLQDHLNYNRTGMTLGASFNVAYRHRFLIESMYIRFFDELKLQRYNDYIVRFRYELII